ncbi:type II secretion system protein N [Phenylobacterium sp.]|jgi:general secretion pathway protein N|uniref:type II secretion system protein N n=1 Tax=Phenylobacterium sp. TaxID=1871053 RepID=UPI0037846417
MARSFDVPMAAVFGLVLLVAAVMLTPLRMVLGWVDADRAGLSAGQVEGSMWRGQLKRASFRGLPLGDAEARLAPLAGGIRLKSAGTLRGEGVVRAAGAGVAVRAVTARAPLSALASALPLQGEATLSDVRAAFKDGRCVEAGGEVRLEALRLGPMALPGLTLAGRPACRDGVWSVPLSGQSSGVAVDARLGVRADGGYRLEIRLRASDPPVAAAAGAAGFARGLDGYSRAFEGRLGG